MTEAPSVHIALLVRVGVLDPELGGLLMVLLEGGMPFVVAGPAGSGGDHVARALAVAAGRASDAVVALAAEGDPDAKAIARRFVAAAAEMAPVYATLDADDLEGLFARLEGPPFRATRDELSPIGLVIVLGGGPTPAGAPARVVAAHWIRPPLRDGHGHVQRFAPAVLATWDPRQDGWEHFAWGVIPELAHRLGMRAGDLEREAAARATRIAGQAASMVDPTAVQPSAPLS